MAEKIENQNPDHKIPILKVPQYENEKIDLLKTIEGVIIDEVDSRVYQNSEALGCLIGYTDNITKEELEKYKFSQKCLWGSSISLLIIAAIIYL